MLTFSALRPAVFVGALPEADLIRRQRSEVRSGHMHILFPALLMVPLVRLRRSVASSTLACDGGQRVVSPQGGGARHGQLRASAGPSRGRRR